MLNNSVTLSKIARYSRIVFYISMTVFIFSLIISAKIAHTDSMPDYSESTADNRSNCPLDTESMFFMGQDESYCYFEDMESGEIISLDK